MAESENEARKKLTFVSGRRENEGEVERGHSPEGRKFFEKLLGRYPWGRVMKDKKNHFHRHQQTRNFYDFPFHPGTSSFFNPFCIHKASFSISF
jgi:hypothetical protein